jgi:hypothetical protein
MSWGSTAFTPIITYNTPPFGFEERPNPSDFPTCPEDPYSGSENLKDRIKEATRLKDAKEFFYIDDNANKNANAHYNDNNLLEGCKTNCIAVYALFIIVLFFIYYYNQR